MRAYPFLIPTLLLASSLQAQPSACLFRTTGVCFNYGGDAVLARQTCERRAGAVFSPTPCATVDLAARCTNQRGAETIETYFYYPQWTLNLVQERCRASGGTVSQ